MRLAKHYKAVLTLSIITLVGLITFSVIIPIRQVSEFIGRIGPLRYLGEKIPAHSLIYDIDQFIEECKGSQRGYIYTEKKNEALIMKCALNETIVYLPLPLERLGPKKELEAYPQRVMDFHEVWNTTLTFLVEIPLGMKQGVFKYPDENTSNPYYFATIPGILTCVYLEELNNTEITFMVEKSVAINQHRIIEPFLIYTYKGENFSICFDLFFSSLTFLEFEKLLRENYRLLAQLDEKNLVELTYELHFYIDISNPQPKGIMRISVGPPYIYHRGATKES